MTYSIVARDRTTGQLGVAVQTCNLAVGTWVPWAEAGVGAVATQALAERSYGTSGLDLIRGGKTASEALNALLAVDGKRDVRQVAIVDHDGNTALHTGHRCFPKAGGYAGDGFCTQANMMERNTVWKAMAQAYQAAEGDLAERLLAALYAAQAEGGDIRGMQTAALLVVDKHPAPFPLVDLRVDYDPAPLDRMSQMLRLHRAYMAEYSIADHVKAGRHEQAHELLNRIGEWAPEESYLQYLRALHLAGHLEQWDEALDVLQPLIKSRPVWHEYLRREAEVDNFGCPGLGKKLLDLLNLRATQRGDA